MEIVDQWEVAGLGLSPLAVPTLELAREVVGLLAEIAQADGIRIERVDATQRVGHGVARVRASGGADRGGRGRIAQHTTVDEVHDVEGGTVDVVVDA